MGQHPQYDPLGPLFQIPTLEPYGQRRVQPQTPATPITNRAHLLGRRMIGIVQVGGVLDQQILAGLLAGRPGALPVRLLNLLEGNLGLIEKPVGGFEFPPRGKGLRQCAARLLNQIRGDFHQALGAASVPQLGRRKFRFGPLGRP